MSVDDGTSNPSENRPFHDVLGVAMSRRSVMVGSLAAAATTLFAPSIVDAKSNGRGNGASNGRGLGRDPGPLVGFRPAENPAGGSPMPTISADYEYQVIIPWGTSLFSSVADLDPTNDATVEANDPEDQERQIGIGHDGMWFFADDESSSRGVLCINHEFGTNSHVLRKSAPADLRDVRKSQAAHGVSVVELAESNGAWSHVVDAPRNRRITVNTPVAFSGPAADSPLLETPAGNPPAGTVNNCANGYTPWGTYLTCEENFNGYFGTARQHNFTDEQMRYGFSSGGFGYGWYDFDARFDLSDPRYTNEENRFGWVVEIDPDDPTAPPVKRTALGRVKHEGVAFAEGRGGRAVCYMGDDERFDYIYKFVSSKNWKSMLARGTSPLDEGTLYVARFNDDFTGDWLELSPNNPLLADKPLEWILVYTRLAADIVGATKMDRPEWTTVGRNGYVYCTLTNNSLRTVPDAANPLAPNPDGHIIRWRDAHRFTGTTFDWDIFVLSVDTQVGTGNPDNGYEFSDPDGLWADPDGRLFIETDGGQPNGRNNQLVVADIARNEFRRLFAGVNVDEITGLTVTPDRQTLFCNTQHPGDGDPAETNFPAPFTGASGPIPRDATFVITKKGGGIVGS